MSEFIAWLEDTNEMDTKMRAVLRRSLAFDPGKHIPAFPYVEPFLKGEAEGWRRQMHYLVAGLWAAHWREDPAGNLIPLAEACAWHKISSGSASTEQRFIHLLNADSKQLPHRLRQMIALLNDQPIDFQKLLNDLLYWNHPDRKVQNAWARDFYHTIAKAETIDTETETAA
jgi:CRISPR system Cascade subunit CasB